MSKEVPPRQSSENENPLENLDIKSGSDQAEFEELDNRSSSDSQNNPDKNPSSEPLKNQNPENDEKTEDENKSEKTGKTGNEDIDEKIKQAQLAKAKAEAKKAEYEAQVAEEKLKVAQTEAEEKAKEKLETKNTNPATQKPETPAKTPPLASNHTEAEKNQENKEGKEESSTKTGEGEKEEENENLVASVKEKLKGLPALVGKFAGPTGVALAGGMVGVLNKAMDVGGGMINFALNGIKSAIEGVKNNPNASFISKTMAGMAHKIFFSSKPKADPAPDPTPPVVATPLPAKTEEKPPKEEESSLDYGPRLNSKEKTFAPLKELIFKHESSPNPPYYRNNYDAYNHGSAGIQRYVLTPPVSEMTIEEIMKKQKRGRKDYLHAVGAYQIIPSTLSEAVSYLKIDKSTVFSESIQDKIFYDYLLKVKRKKAYNFIVHNKGTLQEAQLALAQEWEAFPHKGNRSYYPRKKPGKAHLSSKEFQSIILDMQSIANNEDLTFSSSPKAKKEEESILGSKLVFSTDQLKSIHEIIGDKEHPVMAINNKVAERLTRQLKIKRTESVLGGDTEKGMFIVMHLLEKKFDKYLWRSAAVNDEYHHSQAYKQKKISKGKSPHSVHTEGRCCDYTLKPKYRKNSQKIFGEMIRYLNSIGVYPEKGKSYNEYTNPSVASTGEHFHFQFTRSTLRRLHINYLQQYKKSKNTATKPEPEP